MSHESTFYTLDEHLTRKASRWADVDLIPQQLEELLRGELAALPREIVEGSSRPCHVVLDTPPGVTRKLVFVTADSGTEGSWYFVDTQGSDYARYALRLRHDPLEVNHLRSTTPAQRVVQIAADAVAREARHIADDLDSDNPNAADTALVHELQRIAEHMVA